MLNRLMDRKMTGSSPSDDLTGGQHEHCEM